MRTHETSVPGGAHDLQTHLRSSRPRHFDVEATAVDPEVPQAQPFPNHTKVLQCYCFTEVQHHSDRHSTPLRPSSLTLPPPLPPTSRSSMSSVPSPCFKICIMARPHPRHHHYCPRHPHHHKRPCHRHRHVIVIWATVKMISSIGISIGITIIITIIINIAILIVITIININSSISSIFSSSSSSSSPSSSPPLAASVSSKFRRFHHHQHYQNHHYHHHHQHEHQHQSVMIHDQSQ